MKIVIDIPEEVITNETYTQYFGCMSAKLDEVIHNGTPLPKGHGDLIYRDDLLEDSYCIDDWSGNEVNIVDVMTVRMAETIIEADKEG